MGTKIIELPVTNAVLGDGYIPISQDPTGNNRVTYKVTAQQIANYIGQTTSSGTVNNVDIKSPDSSLVVTGSPITTKGTINISINSVNLNKLDSGGATNGQVLTYDNIVNQWKPLDSANTGVTADSVQIGTVLWFAASSAPTGYLECDGSSKRISDYPELAAVLGITYGNLINGGTEFILPDLRGEFVRGWSHGKTGVDSGRTFGSKQSDAFQGHWHEFYASNGTVDPSINSGSNGIPSTPPANLVRNAVTDGVNGTPRTASETRPRNVALLPCIKAIKTVTKTDQLLNFIEKPPSPTSGQILAYNGSTNTWVASSFFFNNTASFSGFGSGYLTGSFLKAGQNKTFTIPKGIKRIEIIAVGSGGNGGSSSPVSIILLAGTIKTINFLNTDICVPIQSVNSTGYVGGALYSPYDMNSINFDNRGGARGLLGSTKGQRIGTPGGGSGGYVKKTLNVNEGDVFVYTTGIPNGESTISKGSWSMTAGAGGNGTAWVAGTGGTVSGDYDIGYNGESGELNGLGGKQRGVDGNFDSIFSGYIFIKLI